MTPAVSPFFHAGSSTWSYVVSDPGTRAAAIVDPVLDFDMACGRTSTASAEALLAHARRHALDVRWLLETHAHADHLPAEARDRTLPMPALIIPSIQTNIRAGALPPPDANGVRYLRFPLNQIGNRD